MTDTGFDLHVDLAVDGDRIKPDRETLRLCREMLISAAVHQRKKLGRIIQKWLHIDGFGWVWVIGAKYRSN